MGDTYEYIVNRSRDFITLIDRDLRYEIVNDSYCNAIERRREDILHRTVKEVWGSERFNDAIEPRLRACFDGEEVHYVEEFHFGSVRKRLHVSFYPYSDGGSGGEPTHVLVFSHDITYLGQVESRLQQLEYRDRTTGLPNRRSLEEVLANEIDRARRSADSPLRALLFISLRSFKKINQTYGHHIGDLLLEHTANRVREMIRASDMLFRFDGTNLVVLLTSIARPTDVAVVAQKIADDVGVPYQFRGSVISIDSYIGVSIYPDDGDNGDTIIQRANSSSIDAEERKLPFVYYDARVHDAAVARMGTLSDLHSAIADGEFEVYYHPIVRITDRTPCVAGVEALIRWRHPTRGLLAPEDFLELAEGSRLIAAIDKWALFHVTDQLARWSKRYDLFVTLNVSAHEFKDEFLPDVVQSALARHPSLAASRLKLELTETQSMDDVRSSIDQMTELQRIGVDVWIDDFGTGQSSLAYLKQLPATALKIDRSFIEGIEEHDSDREYLAGIFDSIRARGKVVVAEGVTNDRQLELLTDLACDYFQGFIYSQPIPADQIEAILELGVEGRCTGCAAVVLSTKEAID